MKLNCIAFSFEISRSARRDYHWGKNKRNEMFAKEPKSMKNLLRCRKGCYKYKS